MWLQVTEIEYVNIFSICKYNKEIIICLSFNLDSFYLKGQYLKSHLYLNLNMSILSSIIIKLNICYETKINICYIQYEISKLFKYSKSYTSGFIKIISDLRWFESDGGWYFHKKYCSLSKRIASTSIIEKNDRFTSHDLNFINNTQTGLASNHLKAFIYILIAYPHCWKMRCNKSRCYI